MVKKYWKYLCYITGHKWNVLIECFKISQPLHGVSHDMSKFRPSEFFPYADFFYGCKGREKQEEVKKAFDSAWQLHQRRNRHHWGYWLKSDGRPAPMPYKHVMQMIADWRAMARKFGNSAPEHFKKNKHRMQLHADTVKTIEYVFNRDGR